MSKTNKKSIFNFAVQNGYWRNWKRDDFSATKQIKTMTKKRGRKFKRVATLFPEFDLLNIYLESR